MRRYPLAYSLVVLPISIARWSPTSHKKVAFMFFGDTIYNLSGAINVLLFLIVRPKLLLFPPPEDFSEPEASPLGRPTTGSVAKSHRGHGHTASPQSVEIELRDVGDPPFNGNTITVALSRIDSERSDGSV